MFEVASNGYPKAVILEGKAGYGKHRLAQWVVNGARSGNAQVLMAESHPGQPRVCPTCLQVVPHPKP